MYASNIQMHKYNRSIVLKTIGKVQVYYLYETILKLTTTNTYLKKYYIVLLKNNLLKKFTLSMNVFIKISFIYAIVNFLIVHKKCNLPIPNQPYNQ